MHQRFRRPARTSNGPGQRIVFWLWIIFCNLFDVLLLVTPSTEMGRARKLSVGNRPGRKVIVRGQIISARADLWCVLSVLNSIWFYIEYNGVKYVCGKLTVTQRVTSQWPLLMNFLCLLCWHCAWRIKKLVKFRLINYLVTIGCTGGAVWCNLVQMSAPEIKCTKSVVGCEVHGD